MAHVQTTRVSSKGQIVIPEKMRAELAIREGTSLVLIEQGGRIIIEKEKKLLEKMKNLTHEDGEKLGWLLLSEKSLAKDWLSKEEDNAWQDL